MKLNELGKKNDSLNLTSRLDSEYNIKVVNIFLQASLSVKETRNVRKWIVAEYLC